MSFLKIHPSKFYLPAKYSDDHHSLGSVYVCVYIRADRQTARWKYARERERERDMFGKGFQLRFVSAQITHTFQSTKLIT